MLKKIFNVGNLFKFGGIICIISSIMILINQEYINPIHFGIYGLILGILIIIAGFKENKVNNKQDLKD
jgi:hypothetical protein